MPWISLPNELALPHLLDLRGVPMPVRDHLAQLPVQFVQGDPEATLASAAHCYGIAKRGYDRYGQALALIFQAEAYRRLACWEDALDAIRHALRWLELQVAPVVRYNEALTVYLEGVIHFTLQSRDRTAQTFAYAQDILAESERTWGLEGHAGRVADCRNVVRWMAQLLDVQESLQPHICVAVMPVYEFVNRVLIRTDAFALRTSFLSLPAEALTPYLPPGPGPSRHKVPGDGLYVLQEADAHRPRAEERGQLVLPIGSAMLAFPYLDPARSYVAVRAPSDETLWDQGRKGDLLIIEVTGAGESADASSLTADVPFVRRADGRIAMRSGFRDGTEALWPADSSFVGVPRLVIREGDQR
jgi:hypothetical protein